MPTERCDASGDGVCEDRRELEEAGEFAWHEPSQSWVWPVYWWRPRPTPTPIFGFARCPFCDGPLPDVAAIRGERLGAEHHERVRKAIGAGE